MTVFDIWMMGVGVGAGVFAVVMVPVLIVQWVSEKRWKRDLEDRRAALSKQITGTLTAVEPSIDSQQ